MKRAAAICVWLACLAFPLGAQAAPGDLDESFDRDGLLVGNALGTVVDLAVAPDGSILVAETGPGGGSLTRFAPSGYSAAAPPIDDGFSPDPSMVAAIDVRADGRILVGGNGAGGSDFALAERGLEGPRRFVDADFAGGTDRLRDVIAAPGGLAVAAGTVTGPAGNQLGVARYLPDGSLDASFSGDGKLILDTGGASSFAKNAALAVLGDGSILLAGAGPAPDGSGRGDLLLAKFEPDGDLDPTFGGGDGFTTLNIDGRDDAASIAVAPGGEILVGIDACAVGLTTDCNPAIARFTPTGEVDPGFGSGGVVVPSAGAEVRILPNGFVFAAGTTRLREHFQSDFAVGVYLTNGALDTTFSGDGVATADFGLGQDRAVALDLSPDGRPVLAGTTFTDTTRLGLARFEIGPGPADADADAIVDTEDRCPERFSTHDTGCPKIARELKVKAVKGGRLKVKIGADFDLCLERQPLTLEVRKSGRWAKFGQGRTGEQGILVTERPVPDGRYRVKAKATVSEPVGRCASARSKALGIG